MMHKSSQHDKDEGYVIKILSKVIDDMSVAEAQLKLREAQVVGVALLRVYPQEIAEDCCHRIRLGGIKSSVEPV